MHGHNFFICKKGTQPSQTCSEGYTFPATALYRGVSLYLGSRAHVVYFVYLVLISLEIIHLVLGPPDPKSQFFDHLRFVFLFVLWSLWGFGGRKEANRRGFIQIGPCKLLKGAPKDDFFFWSYATLRF